MNKPQPQSPQQQQHNNFESSLSALEKIVRDLERGDLPLEKSLELFEHGVRLAKECQERLNQAERRIEVLLKNGQGRPEVKKFDDGLLAREPELEDQEDESVF